MKIAKKRKSKAILGIAMAAVMIASVMAAMIGSIGAESKGEDYNYITVPQTATQKVLIGQELQFVDEDGNDIKRQVQVSRVVDWSDEWSILSDSNGRLTVSADESQWTKIGAFYVDYLDRYNWSSKLSVSSPSMPLKLKVKTKEVSSLAVGSNLTVDVSGINLFDEDVVDLVIIGPEGQIVYDAINDQDFTNTTVANLRNRYGDCNLATAGWEIGVYTFQVETVSEYACGLEAASGVKEIKVLKGTIAIEADTINTVELRTVKLIVTGVVGDMIKVEATPCEGATFKAGIDDTPVDAGCSFNDTIKSGGVMKYAIEFNDTGSYTIRVTVTSDNARKGEYDTVDITVSEKRLVFDLPSTVGIGDRITIKGTANAGTYVSVFVEDTLYAPLRNLVLEDGEFEKAVTTTDVGMNVPGSVRLKAWIDCAKNCGDDPPTTTPDGEDAILLTTPDLTAKLSPTVVAPKGDFTIEGTTKGVTEVAILCVPPKGGGGNSLTEERRGITLTTASVSATDGTFIKNLTVQENATPGYYDIYVLSPGMDGVWDATCNSSLIGAIYERYNIKDITDPLYAGTKTQDEIYGILVDLTTTAGSDDLMWTEKLKVDTVFDTSSGTYPSISGTHNGTITSYHDLNVSKIYRI